MRAVPIVPAALVVAVVAAGCGDEASPPRAAQTATPTPSPTATPAPAPRPPRPKRLTIGVSGDLLPHMPIVARAAAHAGGRGYDFRPMLRPIRGWVRRNDLSFCHVETPLTPAPPAGYPRLQLAARARARDQGDRLRRVQRRLQPLGRPRPGGHRRHPGLAGPRQGPAHRGLLHPRQRRKPLILRARGVKVALLAYTQHTNGIPLPHPWSVNLATRATHPRRRQARPQAGARVVIVNLHWGTEFVHSPDGFRPRSRDASRARKAITAVVGQHAHVVQPIRRIGRLWVVFGEGNLLSNQTAACCPAASQDGMLVRLHLRVTRRHERVTRIRYTPTWVRHPDYAVLHAHQANRPSWNRTVAVVGRRSKVRPVP